jgi:hypothetical protein
VSDAADRIKQLAAWRARPDRGREVKADVSGFARELRRLEKTIGAASDAWVRIAPPELQRCSVVETFRSGTLTLMVDSSAAAFEVDRALRSGLETNLRLAVPGLMRVRTRVGAPPQP